MGSAHRRGDILERHHPQHAIRRQPGDDRSLPHRVAAQLQQHQIEGLIGKHRHDVALYRVHRQEPSGSGTRQFTAADDAAQASRVVDDGQHAAGNRFEPPADLVHGFVELRHRQIGPHRLLDRQSPQIPMGFMLGHRHAILFQERVVDRNGVQPRRDGIADHVADHQRQDDRVVASHLENDQDRRDWRANRAGKERAHAHQRERPDHLAARPGERMDHVRHRAAEHGADEQRRREDAAGEPAPVRCDRRDALSDREHRHPLPGELTEKRGRQRRITDAERLRQQQTDHGHPGPADRRRRPSRKGRPLAHEQTERQQTADETGRADAREPSQGRIREQFLPVAESIPGYRQRRPAAEDGALDHGGRHRRHDDGTDEPLVEVADHLLHRERDRGDRGIERSGDAGGGADRNQRLDHPRRPSGRSADGGADGGADLNGRPFTPEREPRTDRQRAEHEFSDDRSQRELSARAENISRLDFGNAAAAGKGHDLLEQQANDESDDDEKQRDEHDAPDERRAHQRHEQPVVENVYREVKGDSRQAAQTTDDDGQDEENTGFRMQPAAAEL